MGAKPSTSHQGGTQSPRARAFSTSSSSEVVTNTPSFRFMRTLGMDMSSNNDNRQRARSLSSVPDLHNTSHDTIAIPTSVASFDVVSTGHHSPETDSGSPTNEATAPTTLVNNSSTSTIVLERLHGCFPSHIGITCPVCSKFLIADDIECHLVMCLTKPRLSYNEDVLTEDKDECVICLEELSRGDVIARLPCLCIYHKICLDQWFEVNRSCPEHPGD